MSNRIFVSNLCLFGASRPPQGRGGARAENSSSTSIARVDMDEALRDDDYRKTVGYDQLCEIASRRIGRDALQSDRDAGRPHRGDDPGDFSGGLGGLGHGSGSRRRRSRRCSTMSASRRGDSARPNSPSRSAAMSATRSPISGRHRPPRRRGRDRGRGGVASLQDGALGQDRPGLVRQCLPARDDAPLAAGAAQAHSGDRDPGGTPAGRALGPADHRHRHPLCRQCRAQERRA